MGDDDRRIFVGGLRFSTEVSTLTEYFSQWGHLEEVKIVRYPPPDNRSKGFGFITFGNQAARDSCVAQEIHEVDGKTIEIRLADSSHKEKQRSFTNHRQEEVSDVNLEDVKFRRLFVGNIDHNWDDAVIRDYFCNIGSVQECTVKKGPEGKPLGFAFMTFATSACVDKIQQLRPHTIQGRKVETKRQVAKQYVGTPEAKLEVDRIWVGAAENDRREGGLRHVGLGDEHTDEVLQTYFSNYGTVVKVQQLMWDDTKKKRGYGFIIFDDFDAVDKVVLSMVHSIAGVKIQVKKAVKDKDKLSQRGMNFSNNRNNVNNMSNMGGMNNMNTMNNMSGMNNMNNMSGMNDMNMMGGMGGMGSGGMERNGRKRGMETQMMPKKKIRMEARDPESELMRSIFVGNLNPLSVKADLEEYFAKFGNVSEVNLKTQPGSDRNKGFAFVIFSKSEDVDNVMAAKPHRLTGTNIDCKRKTPKSEAPMMEERVKKIWIGRPEAEYGIKSYGLNETTTDEVLTEYFSKHGRVTDIHQFVWKDTQKKRGYGYITFESEDSVDKVVLLGIHTIVGIQLQCKKAMSKDAQDAIDRKKMAFSQNSEINYGGMNNMGVGGGMNNMSGGGMNNMGVGMSNMGGGMNNMGGRMNNMGVGMGGGMNNMGGGMNTMGGGMGMGGGMNNMGVGMNNMAVGMGMGGGMNNMGGGMNNMAGGMGITGGMNTMGGGVGMGGGMGNMGGLGNMGTPPPSLPSNRGNMNKMGNMQNNMQSMMNKMEKGNDSYNSNNMQDMLTQMNTLTNSSGNMTGNMKSMMNNMNSMMGSIAKDDTVKGKSDGQEKMMGMMSNMMSMMNNMASMMQTNMKEEPAAPAPPPASTTYNSSGPNYSTPAPNRQPPGGQSSGYGSGRNTTSGSGSTSSYSSSQPAPTYGYGYGN